MSPHGKISLRLFRPFRGDARNAARLFSYLPLVSSGLVSSGLVSSGLVSSGLVSSSLGRYVRVTSLDANSKKWRIHTDSHICAVVRNREKGMTKAARTWAKGAGFERLCRIVRLISVYKSVNKPKAFGPHSCRMTG